MGGGVESQRVAVADKPVAANADSVVKGVGAYLACFVGIHNVAASAFYGGHAVVSGRAVEIPIISFHGSFLPGLSRQCG